MSGFTPVIILILVMLIQALMRLSPNVFALLQHSAIAKKPARETKKSRVASRRSDESSAAFVLGAEIATAILLTVTFIIITFAFNAQTFLNKTFVWILFGLSVAEAIANFFFYFKRKNTRLFIPRRLAKTLTKKAEENKTKTGALFLGFLTRLVELPFTFLLFILAAFATTKTSTIPNYIITIIYLVVAALPFFVIYACFHSGRNLADFERFQAKTKFASRIIISLSYIALAVILLNLGLSL